ncbi:conserved membrane protein of unknown function [Thauera humireducens]|uniref:hypothetical protein n=1 Tax=Thauera humireducens TaxID=1134435 RepID=UPI002467A509|nr:hypothetical protein [Thauera humireducens]CAH1746848.1 conserved membrane protein of unknown function [Thauera humireducens]
MTNSIGPSHRSIFAGLSPASIRAWSTSLTGTRLLGAVALLLSMMLAASMGEIINRDGIIYVRAAQAFLDDGLSAAMEVYNWPAYSILIALLSGMSGLSLETAAHLVNAGLMVLLLDSFIRLCRQLDPVSARPWIAALVFLTFPPLAHSLEIYRDWGYLAFAMFAFTHLLRFWQDDVGQIKDALLWQGGMFAATLFRVEGAALLVLAPLALIFQARPWRARMWRTFLASSWSLPALLLGIALLALGEVQLGKFRDLLVYSNPSTVFGAFNDVAQQFSSALNKYSDDFAPHMLASGIVTVATWMALKNLGAFIGLITLFGAYQFGLPRQNGYRLIYALIGIVTLIVITFLAARLIIVGRYALLASCLLMTITVWVSTRLFEASKRNRRGYRWAWLVVFTGLVIGALVNIGARPDYKAYIRDAGQWIKHSVPADTLVITNDFIIDYYAERPHGPKLDRLDKVRDHLAATSPPYYVVLRLKDHDMDEARALFATGPAKEFRSSRSPEGILIFHVKTP